MFTASWAFTEQIYGTNPRFEEPGVALTIIAMTLLMVLAVVFISPDRSNWFGHGLDQRIKKEVK
ncbi:MAG: hypothetical protein ABIA47_01545 [bacterium]